MTSPDPIQAALDFQKGSEKAFEYFFNEYYGELLLFAKKRLSDEDDAKDVVSESFIDVWRNRDALSHPQVIRKWLYTSVRFGCLNRLKQLEKSSGQLPEIADGSLCDMIAAKYYVAVWGLVKQLPTKCRDIIVMRYVYEMPVVEIMKKTGLKNSTIKNQLARGIKLLRKKYGTTDEQAKEKDQHLYMKIITSEKSHRNLMRLYGIKEKNIQWIKKKYNLNTP
jgi:RNA polymerase sigma factor (sigma-70 family)